MSILMDSLYRYLKPLIDASWFNAVVSFLVFANPLAIFPQVISVFTAPSIEGISIGMWALFAIIQAAYVFYGIKTKSASVFFSMLISFLESVIIILMVFIRS